ncbi:response regulator PleD [Variibacter gotjawalensis]|uniref:diguanylate cyclase n=1 Tax=Variibacter gotjawalensis TaxID=1333996 RepID=A0A0S3PVH6_9BRAD|nr:diguanylate cyclase response regulator [Variibacter gotjawalensis]NIK45735.1 diguanylate cyclase (GGDEF)-like protein [Variibacter gotjawalensis]RZS47659.1 diguanylate cyclase (GGDEF)-like protein [Variibacter gotjawalensis]BAT59912.1 response regulator PleD [Variibacter gotjawalensis]
MHVVVVDPSRTVLMIASQLIGGQGHIVHTFTDPHVALDHLRTHDEVDALITCSEYDGMTGLQLCAEARTAVGAERPLYVILMSSTKERGRRAAALDAGADDFMRKPPEPDEFYARLRAAERVISLQRELMRLANTDPLSGLLNRRALFRRAGEARERAAAGRFLTAVMFDIDHFKRINDTYGHDAGDRAIQVVAHEIKRAFPIAGRLGGEEFVGFMEEATLMETAARGEQLRRTLQDMDIGAGKATINLTISAGVSLFRAGETVDAFLQRADNALYAAKSAGRNRIITETNVVVPDGVARPTRLRQGNRAPSNANVSSDPQTRRPLASG